MKALSGNSAIAEAVKQVKPDLIVCYPVAPATSILEDIANFISDGKLDSEFLNIESDHSAISACIGASAAGGRVFTATASQGLAYMHEILFIASSFRLPIVVAVTNRALSAPINVHADHSDSMAQRDCGWLQIYSENSQEAYDNIIQAFRIAEHPDVKTPVMVGLDGFITSHTVTNIHVEKTDEITDFIGKCIPDYSLLDVRKSITLGSINRPDYYFEHKVNQFEGVKNSSSVIKDIGKEYGDRFGRYYGFFESYRLEDADYAIVLMSSSAGTAKELVDVLRKKGVNAGLLKLRIFRPFPYEELRETLAHLKSIAVLDRVLTPGSFGGPLFNEIRSALFDLGKKPMVFPYVYGLGGRDIELKHLEGVFREIKEKVEQKEKVKVEVQFINLRE